MAWLPPEESEFGLRVRRSLVEEWVLWYTSVARDGTPQPNPVWFVREGDSILTYNRATAARVVHARRGGRVALHFDSHDAGTEVIVFVGPAEIDEQASPAHENAAYLGKYRERILSVNPTLPQFSQAYPVAIRVWPERTRGF